MDEETISDGPNGGDRPPPLPARIGPYLVIGRLGSGGMGEVFLAWDEKLERRVALKRIRQDIGLSPEQRERFRREATSAASLSHANVVQIYQLIDDPEEAIVMEYIEGQTLAERLSRERLEMPDILRLACEIAKGLFAAHEKGLIHRDLKAANIMITGAGQAQILDFGLARPVVRESQDPGITQQGVTLGTCYAMSPEQARGQEVDKRSDLFSFGSLFHEILTGRPPFRGKDPLGSLQKVLNEEPVHPQQARPDLPDEVAELLLRLLEKDREKRPANAREVITILERHRTPPTGPQSVAPEGPVHDFPTADTTRLERPAPLPRDPSSSPGQPVPWTRRLLLMGAVAALLIAGAVALFLAISSVRRSNVHDENWAAFVPIQKRVNDGEVRREDLARLEEMIATSPDFVDARVLASRIAYALFEEQQEPADLEKASELTSRAMDLFPNNASLLRQACRIALNGNHIEEAETFLARLQVLTPDDPEILPLRAELAEKRGHTDEAASLLTEAVEQEPTWQNRYRLASFAARHGRIKEARSQIDKILKNAPRNVWALERLGALALSYGDLDQAERIYRSLPKPASERVESNLATILVLRGRPREAAKLYRRALEIRPDSIDAMINLAEVEKDLGHKSEATKLYERALSRLEMIEDRSSLSISDAMSKAQCLAQLGRTREAVGIVERKGDKILNDPHLLLQSAQIYSLAGDRQSALAAAEAALNRGLPQRWFGGPDLRWIRESSELRSRFQIDPGSL